MKVFICLLATFAVCNATFFSGSGSGNTVTYNVVPSLGHGQSGSHGHGHVESYGHGHGNSHGHSHVQSYDQGHGHSHGYSHGNSHGYEIAPQVIKVIVEESRGYDGGANIHSYDNSYDNSYASAPEAEIFKVIQESAPISHGYSGGGHAEYAVLDAGHSYDSDYSHNSHGSHGSGGDSIQLNSILPQILQIIEQDGGGFGSSGFGSGGFGSGGSSGYYSQLIDAYGHSGSGIAKRLKKGKSSYYNSGHVIEKGVLELSKGNKKAGGGGGGGGSSGGGGLGNLLSRLTSSIGAIGGQGSSGHSQGSSGHPPVNSGW